MKLSTYLRGVADKIDNSTFTKSDIIATIGELIKEFYYVPDFICETHFTRENGVEKMVKL